MLLFPLPCSNKLPGDLLVAALSNSPACNEIFHIVYNKHFRLKFLMLSILKTKSRAPGPDGIHNKPWNIFLGMHWKFSKNSWLTSGSMGAFDISEEQQLYSPFPNQTRTTLIHSVTDQSFWTDAYARSWSVWLMPSLVRLPEYMWWVQTN